MEVASLVVAIIGCITSIPGLIAYFEVKAKEKEKFKHALENRQLFNEFVSRADGSIKLFKSALDAYNYCNGFIESKQYFTDKEKQLEEHDEWFERTTKTFVIRNIIYKKYKKLILNAIIEDDKDCQDLCNEMVENAKKSIKKINVLMK